MQNPIPTDPSKKAKKKEGKKDRNYKSRNMQSSYNSGRDWADGLGG